MSVEEVHRLAFANDDSIIALGLLYNISTELKAKDINGLRAWIRKAEQPRKGHVGPHKLVSTDEVQFILSLLRERNSLRLKTLQMLISEIYDGAEHPTVSISTLARTLENKGITYKSLTCGAIYMLISMNSLIAWRALPM